MNHYVELLKGVLKIPKTLDRIPIESWMSAEQFVGFSVPKSYKELLWEIGDGQWGGFFSIQTADSMMQCQYDFASDSFSIDFPEYSFFQPGSLVQGLFPWGFTDSRTTLFWHLEDSPSGDFPIVILEHGFPPETWLMSVPEFLWKHYCGEIESYLFPANLRTSPKIRSWRDFGKFGPSGDSLPS